MSQHIERGRPATTPDDLTSDSIRRTPSIDPDADMRQRIMGCFVAVVQIRSEAAEPRYSRRVYLSLAPAQKAAQRAQERGLHASVYVAELRPVGLAGGAEHE